MGMYTELVLKCRVKEKLPDEVRDVLNFLFSEEAEPSVLPDHIFFKSPRWGLVGRCASYYHIPWVSSWYAENRIFSRSDLKNYDGEIKHFLNWLQPYLDEEPGRCIGWTWYEEELSPTLIYAE